MVFNLLTLMKMGYPSVNISFNKLIENNQYIFYK